MKLVNWCTCSRLPCNGTFAPAVNALPSGKRITKSIAKRIDVAFTFIILRQLYAVCVSFSVQKLSKLRVCWGWQVILVVPICAIYMVKKNFHDKKYFLYLLLFLMHQFIKFISTEKPDKDVYSLKDQFSRKGDEFNLIWQETFVSHHRLSMFCLENKPYKKHSFTKEIRSIIKDYCKLSRQKLN